MVLTQVQLRAKSAVFLAPISRYEQSSYKLGKVGDGWITTTRFDKDFKIGISGQVGGTTSEFVDSFTEKLGVPPIMFSGVSF